MAPYGVQAEVDYTRNVPPVDNEATSVELLAAAVRGDRGRGRAWSAPSRASAARTSPGTSRSVPGALARLGVQPARGAAEDRLDLHQGRFDADERAIPVGARVLVAATSSRCSRSDNGCLHIWLTGRGSGRQVG